MEIVDIEKKVIEEGVKSLFKMVSSVFKEIGKRSIVEIEIMAALREYTNNYIRRHGQIKVLGMPEPISLLDIYTYVRTISPVYRHREKAIDELEDNFRRNRGDFGLRNNKSSGLEMANSEEKLNILGSPGSGKSTFLKRIGMGALLADRISGFGSETEIYAHDCIPVLIELRRFRNEHIDLLSIIQNEFEIVGFPESQIFVERALKHGRLLILLDGLDEVPKNKLEEVLLHIKDFTDKYKENRYVTSCRTAFYKSYLTDFTDVEIASFDNSQIERFIQNWFKQEKDKGADVGNRFSTLLFDKGNEAVLELAGTPLLLTFLCLTFDESQRFPANRSSLYRRALYILLEKWAAEKRIHNEDIYQDLNSDLEIEMLSELAAKFYVQDKIFFYENEIKNFIAAFLEDTLNIRSISISKIIEAIEIQQGLLVQRAPEIYSFSHLTIQEYLTAHYYYSPQRVGTLIQDHIFENRWREVFLLLAGMSTANDLILMMNDHLKKVAKEDSLIKATVEWINSVLPLTGDITKDTCKRLFLANLLLRYKRYDRSYMGQTPQRIEISGNKLIDGIDPSFGRSFILGETINRKEAIKILEVISNWRGSSQDLSMYIEMINSTLPSVPLSKMLEGSRHQYRKELANLVYDALQVPVELIGLHKKDYQSLINYFEGYTLIVDCINSSLRVSKEIQTKIYFDLLSIN